MGNKVKIVLASGVFYPEVGGPAIHTRHIAERLASEGCEVVVVTYSDSDESDNFPFIVKRIPRQYPKIFRWLLYSWNVLVASLSSDVIYAFDVSAAGLPAFITAKLLGKKFVIRIGGDPIWEREVEKKRSFVSMEEYYKNGLHKQARPLLFKMIRFMLLRSDKIVTYTYILVDLYTKHYHIPESKFLKIENPFLSQKTISDVADSYEPTFLFAGRFVSYKNLLLVIKSFDKVRKKHKTGILKLIGSGPDEEELRACIKKLEATDYIHIAPSVSQEELFEEISHASACLAPALTEFSPNFILECLSFKKPVIVSRGNGLPVSLPDEFLFSVNDGKELEKKLEQFFDAAFYTWAHDQVSKFEMNHTWEDVVESHYELIRDLTKR